MSDQMRGGFMTRDAAVEAARREGYIEGLDRALELALGESLCDDLDNDSDRAYQDAIHDCARAIREAAIRARKGEA